MSLHQNRFLLQGRRIDALLVRQMSAAKEKKMSVQLKKKSNALYILKLALLIFP